MEEKSNGEEIVFLESEIIEDDDSAPFGVLIAAHGKDEAEKDVGESNFEQSFFGNNADTASINAEEKAAAEVETPIDNAEVAKVAEADAQNTLSEAAADVQPAAATQEPIFIVTESADEPQITAKAADDAKTETEENKNAVSEDSVWAVADIKPVKAAAAKKPEQTKEGETQMKNEKKPAETEVKKSPKTASAPKKATAAKPAVKKEDGEKAAAPKAAKSAVKPDKAQKSAKSAKPDAKTDSGAVKAEAKAKKAEHVEEVIVPGDESIPHGKFVIKKTDKGNFVYKLYSFNHRVVAIGAEQYSSLATCKTGINSVIKNASKAPVEDQTLKKWEEQKCPKWQIYTDKKGEIRLRLLASNGNIVATTNDGYLSKDAAKNGIEAVGRAAGGAAIVRNDNLW